MAKDGRTSNYYPKHVYIGRVAFWHIRDKFIILAYTECDVAHNIGSACDPKTL